MLGAGEVPGNLHFRKHLWSQDQAEKYWGFFFFLFAWLSLIGSLTLTAPSRSLLWLPASPSPSAMAKPPPTPPWASLQSCHWLCPSRLLPGGSGHMSVE